MNNPEVEASRWYGRVTERELQLRRCIPLVVRAPSTTGSDRLHTHLMDMLGVGTQSSSIHPHPRHRMNPYRLSIFNLDLIST
jgi:hypothetical protein